MPTLATHTTCTGCMGCLNACPKGAIEKKVYPDGHFGIRVLKDACVECGMCERVCPIVNGISYGCLKRPKHTFAAWAEDEAVRRRGATAGIFGALALKMIRDGGCVAGVVMEGLDCRYVLTDRPEEIARMQGSKYTASQPECIYKKITVELRKGRPVLFCGLPCHVAALLSYVPKQLQEHLLMVDIICGGVSSPLLIKRYVEEKQDVASIESFRNKEEGWRPTGYRYNLKYITSEGKIVATADEGRNLVTDGFACELTDRLSCYNCRMAFPSRKSDMTIGDLWGDRDFPAQHRDGLSSVLIHSEKGMEFLKEAGIHIEPIDAEKALIPNSRIFNGRSIKRYFPERFWLARGLRNLKYPALMKIYAGDLRSAGVFWWPFAAYRLLSFRLAEFVRKWQNRRLLHEMNNE